MAVEDVLDAAALDPYTYLRDAYLQRREYLVNDGNTASTEEEEFDNLFEDIEALPGDSDQAESETTENTKATEEDVLDDVFEAENETTTEGDPLLE
jgi:phospholipid-binding lipoprotein MlaA